MLPPEPARQRIELRSGSVSRNPQAAGTCRAKHFLAVRSKRMPGEGWLPIDPCPVDAEANRARLHTLRAAMVIDAMASRAGDYRQVR